VCAGFSGDGVSPSAPAVAATLESSRPSLRALARELGAAYQLLSFYPKELPGRPAKCNAYSPWNREAARGFNATENSPIALEDLPEI
jgi:hypothetical protein